VAVDLIEDRGEQGLAGELRAPMDVLMRRSEVDLVVDVCHRFHRYQALDPGEADDAAGGHDQESDQTLLRVDEELVHLANAVQMRVDDRHASEVIGRLPEPDGRLPEPDAAVLEVRSTYARPCRRGSVLPVVCANEAPRPSRGSSICCSPGHVARAITWTATIMTTIAAVAPAAMRRHGDGSGRRDGTDLVMALRSQGQV
jgi:hypothetical protein